jgi:hypothetical protein
LIAFSRIELIMKEVGDIAIRAGVRRAHVWAIHSTENAKTCTSLWHSNLRDRISLTLGTADHPMGRDLETIADDAIEHHGAQPEFAIIGYRNDAVADPIMAERGYERRPSTATLEYRRMSKVTGEARKTS